MKQIEKNCVYGRYFGDYGISIDNRSTRPIVRISRKHRVIDEFLIQSGDIEKLFQEAYGFNKGTPDIELLNALFTEICAGVNKGERK